jgi:hypothetical protein
VNNRKLTMSVLDAWGLAAFFAGALLVVGLGMLLDGHLRHLPKTDGLYATAWILIATAALCDSYAGAGVHALRGRKSHWLLFNVIGAILGSLFVGFVFLL